MHKYSMNEIDIVKVNESFLEIHANPDLMNELWSRYSAFKAGYQFNPKFKNHIWDGKIRMFNLQTGFLPIGFFNDLISYCKKKSYSYELEGFSQFDLDYSLDEAWYMRQIKENMKSCQFSLRSYQDCAVRAALSYKKGILLSCTGSGKSLMIYNIIKSLQSKGLKKILLIVPNIMLIDQMHDDMIEYGSQEYESDLTLMGGGHKPDLSKPVLISTWESLQNESGDFFEDYEAVIVDECHGSKAMKLCGIIKRCCNARYKIGTTGTLPTDAADLLTIKSVLGEVLFQVTSKELIDAGVLTKIQIAGIRLKYPLDFIMQNRGREYQEEVKMVEEYPSRNNALKMIIDHMNPAHNLLILVNHLSHLESVSAWINTNYPGKKVSIISGAVKREARNEIRTEMENEDGTILLATYATMSTGVNIPKLHAIILFSNSKSKIKVLQTIGRGLRRHLTKDKIILYDIIDDLSYMTRNGKVVENYLVKHFNERCVYYAEQEFPIVTMNMNI